MKSRFDVWGCMHVGFCLITFLKLLLSKNVRQLSLFCGILFDRSWENAEGELRYSFHSSVL